MTPINIALVDDEQDVEFLYRAALRKEISSKKIHLNFFTNGQELLDFLRSKYEEVKILILVSDINMPNMDGLTLVGIINKEFPKIDLYLSSAYEKPSADEINNISIKDYLQKPVDFDHLKKIIDLKVNEINN